MTQQTPYPPAMPPQAAPAPPRNGLGTTGFVLGLVGLAFSPIPFVGVVAWPLVILGVVFSAVGLARVRKGNATNKGLSITGIVLSLLGLGVCITWIFVFNRAVDEVNEELNRTASVTYEVTGTAENVEVLYGEVLNPRTETAPTLPWTKKTENKGAFKGGTLTALADENGGSVTCKITVDGKVVATNTASGPLAQAVCTGI
ncbi:MmpS family transport accessory protein [Amycolatopsis anabasis]|uniref:MmpS family transport accessory protein n=1 Tax=Amycolatopsis anabasis TaxID=1840409 RepID=UPI001FEA4B68|nr:MmpS family transport accessory protein [Amycolatopsis anabasis]